MAKYIRPDAKEKALMATFIAHQDQQRRGRTSRAADQSPTRPEVQFEEVGRVGALHMVRVKKKDG